MPVRVGFLVASAFGGLGVMLYAGLWMVLPAQRHFTDDAPGLAAASRQGRRRPFQRRLRDQGPLLAIGAIVVGIITLVSALNGSLLWAWPTMLAIGGIGLLWRQADEAQRERWADSTGRLTPGRALLGHGWWGVGRVGAGVLLLLLGIILFIARAGNWSAAVGAGLAAVLGLVGLTFILGPWLFRMSSDLSEERAERVRSQERADVAAHLHDSVLQTLALIQTSAHDPARVAALARRQERDLRGWLFETSGADPTTLSASLRAIAGDVEDAHGVPVEIVCVGDRRVDPLLEPLVLATREAVMNAARHSGAANVDVYAEIGAESVEVFVRDRGTGFDLGSVATDRHGVRDSIIDRMQRHGGDAEVRSKAGYGTEVRLTLPHRESGEKS